jgi:hypothetical protein
MSGREIRGTGSKLAAILVVVVIAQAFFIGFLYLQFTDVSGQVSQLQRSINDNQSQLQNQTQSLISEFQAYVRGVLNDTSLPNGGLFAITSAYATGSGPWNITLNGLNFQKTTVTLTQMLVGGTAYTDTVPPYVFPLVLQPWTTFHVSFILNSGGSGRYAAGMSIPIALITSSGSTYSTAAVLPSIEPQQNEKLLISAYPGEGATPDLVISVTNPGSSAINVTLVQIDGISVPNAFYSVDVVGNFTGSGPWGLASGATSTFVMYHGEVVGPAPCGMGFIDGMSYPVTVATAAGNIYPSAITWP